MPTLSLTPALTGSPPESDLAKANGEAEGSEGKNTAGKKSGTEENTWTRLFQSYIQQNKQSTTGTTKSDSKSVSEKSKTASEPSSQGIVPASSPVITASPLVPVVQATSVNAAVPNAPLNTSTPVAAGTEPVPVRISSNGSATPKATVASSAPAASAVSVRPTGLAYSATHVDVSQQLVPSIQSSAPAKVRSPLSVATTQTSGSSPISSSPATTEEQAPAAPTPTTSLTNTQQVTLQQSMPSAVLSALQTVQPVLTPNAASSAIPTPKNSNGQITKAGMERSLVLGDVSSAGSKPVVYKEEASGGDSSLTEGSTATTEKTGKENRPSDGDGSFSNVLSSIEPSVTTSAASASMVTTSSHDERMAVVNQISSHIQSMQPGTSNPNTLTVTVQPPHWGDVKIAVTLDPTQPATAGTTNISATVTASTSEVQGVLQQHVQDLRTALGSAGLHLDKLDIGVGTVAAMSQSGSSSGHHAGQQGNGSGNPDFQSSFANSSSSSGGSFGQFQSASSWADGDTPGVQSSSAATTTTASPATSDSMSDSASTSRIDMRA